MVILLQHVAQRVGGDTRQTPNKVLWDTNFNIGKAFNLNILRNRVGSIYKLRSVFFVNWSFVAAI